MSGLLSGQDIYLQLTRLRGFCVVPQAVKAFIRSQDIYQCDFWEVAPVQQLSKEPQHAPLRRLLDVMLNGDLQGFKAAATPAVLQVGFRGRV
jgi:hypothetical protein